MNQRILLLAALLTTSLTRWPAAALAEPPAPAARVPVRVVEGRLVVACDVSTSARRIPANLFVELETPCALRLHNRAAQALSAESADGKPNPITLHLPGIDVEVASREHGDEDVWEEFTKYHSKELGEDAVIGVIGAQLLGRYHLTLDLAQGFLYLAAPRERSSETPPVAAGSTGVTLTLTADLLWLPVRFADDTPAAALLTTGRFDSLLDLPMARARGHRDGDIGPLYLGDIDLSRFVAWRPEEVAHIHTDGVAGTLGLNLLGHFRIDIDRVNRRATFTQTRPADFPAADLEWFRARAAGDRASIEQYLAQYPTARLSGDAARSLLDLQLDDQADADAIAHTLGILCTTWKEDLRATAALDLMKELQADGFAEAVIAAGELGVANGRKDRYPDAVYQIHSRLGQALFERSAGRDAWKHLLSAAFGLPEDGMVNLYLGLFYEGEGRYKRAFSRFVQAVIKPESGKRAFEGLERMQRQLSGEERMSVDTIDRLIAGKVLNFGAATRFRPDADDSTNRVVLCELFTNAHLKPGLAGALGNEGLAGHFPRERVAMLSWHLPGPKLEPLVNEMGLRRAEDAQISRAAHLIDGVVTGPGAARTEQREDLFNLVRDQVSERLKKPADYQLDLQAQLVAGSVTGSVTITGPKRFGRLLYVVLAERGVLFPGENEVVIHRFVGRGSLLDDDNDGVMYQPTDGGMTVTFSRALADITRANDRFLDQTMNRGGGSTVKMSLDIDPAQVTIVAFLRDVTTNEILQAAQIDPDRAESP